MRVMERVSKVVGANLTQTNDDVPYRLLTASRVNP